MTNNPSCPYCGSNARINKYLRSGKIQYRCNSKACGKAFTPGREKGGRPMLGDRPLTAAERMRRSRAAKKNR